jgi:hypothetical protein
MRGLPRSVALGPSPHTSNRSKCRPTMRRHHGPLPNRQPLTHPHRQHPPAEPKHQTARALADTRRHLPPTAPPRSPPRRSAATSTPPVHPPGPRPLHRTAHATQAPFFRQPPTKPAVSCGRLDRFVTAPSDDLQEGGSLAQTLASPGEGRRERRRPGALGARPRRQLAGARDATPGFKGCGARWLGRRALALRARSCPCAGPKGVTAPSSGGPVGEVVHVDRYGNRPFRGRA